MKVLFFSDLHLGAKLFNSIELHDDLFALLPVVVDAAKGNQVDVVFLCGDLFDNLRPTPWAATSVLRTKQHLLPGVELTGICGDHDKAVGGLCWLDVLFDRKMPESGVVLAAGETICGVDYNDEPAKVIQAVNDLPKELARKIQILCFHGQVPDIFKYCDEKKTLILKDIDFKKFPELRGFVLGDIHRPLSWSFYCPELNRDLFVEYCGSTGLVRVEEVGDAKRFLIWDTEKKTMERVRYAFGRPVLRIAASEGITDLTKKELLESKIKPLLVVDCETAEQEKDPRWDVFRSACIFRAVRRGLSEEETYAVNLRGSVDYTTQITKVLKEIFKDNLCALKLAGRLVETEQNKEDPRTILDEFKSEIFSTGKE